MSQQVFTLIQITYTAAVPLLLAWLGNIIKKQDGGKKADCLLLRKALIDIHDEAIKQGYITQPNFQAFEDIWKVYHDTYNGNTLTDKYRDELHNMPVK